MKIVVLGKGFLGKAFEKEGFEVFDRQKFRLERTYDERERKEQLEKLSNYEIIINCIGKSVTRYCEDSKNFPEVEFSNSTLPGILSRYCENRKKKFVHISTGCLYYVKDIPQKETDFIAAHCKYTVSKWIGEIKCNEERDLILRPRLYFGDFEDRNNLVCKIPKFSYYLNELNSYTSVHEIVDSTKALLEKEQRGIFNVACDGISSTKEIAKLIRLEDKPEISAHILCKQEGLTLVNNIMDLTKLKQFHKPRNLKKEILRCYDSLQNSKNITI